MPSLAAAAALMVALSICARFYKSRVYYFAGVGIAAICCSRETIRGDQDLTLTDYHDRRTTSFKW